MLWEEVLGKASRCVDLLSSICVCPWSNDPQSLGQIVGLNSSGTEESLRAILRTKGALLARGTMMFFYHVEG